MVDPEFLIQFDEITSVSMAQKGNKTTNDSSKTVK